MGTEITLKIELPFFVDGFDANVMKSVAEGAINKHLDYIREYKHPNAPKGDCKVTLKVIYEDIA